MPFAFTDIEMMFDDECRAVDWVFRYGNQALAKLEKVPPREINRKPVWKYFSEHGQEVAAML